MRTTKINKLITYISSVSDIKEYLRQTKLEFNLTEMFDTSIELLKEELSAGNITPDRFELAKTQNLKYLTELHALLKTKPKRKAKVKTVSKNLDLKLDLPEY